MSRLYRRCGVLMVPLGAAAAGVVNAMGLLEQRMTVRMLAPNEAPSLSCLVDSGLRSDSLVQLPRGEVLATQRFDSTVLIVAKAFPGLLEVAKEFPMGMVPIADDQPGWVVPGKGIYRIDLALSEPQMPLLEGRLSRFRELAYVAGFGWVYPEGTSLKLPLFKDAKGQLRGTPHTTHPLKAELKTLGSHVPPPAPAPPPFSPNNPLPPEHVGGIELRSSWSPGAGIQLEMARRSPTGMLFFDKTTSKVIAVSALLDPPVQAVAEARDVFPTRYGFHYLTRSGTLGSVELRNHTDFTVPPLLETVHAENLSMEKTRHSAYHVDAGNEYFVFESGVYRRKANREEKFQLAFALTNAAINSSAVLESGLMVITTDRNELHVANLRQPVVKLSTPVSITLSIPEPHQAPGPRLEVRAFAMGTALRVGDVGGVLTQLGKQLILQPVERLPEEGSGVHFKALGYLSGIGISVVRPLKDAEVKQTSFPTGLGGEPNDDIEKEVKLTVSHPCASAWVEKGRTTLEVLDPHGDPVPATFRLGKMRSDGVADLLYSVLTNKHGSWTFQLRARTSPHSATWAVGAPQRVTFGSASPPPKQFWRYFEHASYAATAALVALNLVLFALSRKSDRAWRMATSATLWKSVFRVPTIVLGFVPFTQKWVLDRYFQRWRAQHQHVPDILPLPLSKAGGPPASSTDAVSAPWVTPAGPRRIWIEGRTGMGKTALVRWVCAKHFFESETSFAAFEKWGCVLVQFDARNHVTSAEDSFDPAWVLGAVEVGLSAQGMTFENKRLLQEMLSSGVLGIVIDGLHEANRYKAVKAFCSAYRAVPMLVTAQASDYAEGFEVYRLPESMQDYTFDLLALLMGNNEKSKDAERQLHACGLGAAVRSGYDVRLLSEWFSSAALGAQLPRDRAGLYELALRAGWPSSLHNSDLATLEAAAWRLVAELPVYSDRRRLVGEEHAPRALLEELAAAPNRGIPVRLVRRVIGGEKAAFEFAHDQMHAYLAARHFTGSGLTCGQQVQMLEGATLWHRPLEERRTVWSFAMPMLEGRRVAELFRAVEAVEEWDSLRRALQDEGTRRGVVVSARAIDDVSAQSPLA